MLASLGMGGSIAGAEDELAQFAKEGNKVS